MSSTTFSIMKGWTGYITKAARLKGYVCDLCGWSQMCMILSIFAALHLTPKAAALPYVCLRLADLRTLAVPC